MAGMDLSFRRADRGVSVFWMILAMGAGVFALLAILIVGTEGAGDPVERDAAPEITVNEGETQVNGIANTEAVSNDNDATFLGDTQTVSGPLSEGDTANEDVEVEVAPAVPVGGAVVEPAEAGTDADAGMEQGAGLAEDATAEPVAPGAGEVVVDPDGTTAPVVPTPSGPEGRDDATIAD